MTITLNHPDVSNGVSDLAVEKEHVITIRTLTVPIVFLPGIMGTRLQRSGSLTKETAWDPDDVHGSLFFMVKSAAERRNSLVDPKGYDDNVIWVKVAGRNGHLTRVGDADRGWLALHQGSYRELLDLLNSIDPENLNRAVPESKIFLDAFGKNAPTQRDSSAEALSALREIAKEGMIRMPVYAYGYNWTRPISEIAQDLNSKFLKPLVAKYNDHASDCRGVILVTHSMGGLVSRAVSKQLGASDSTILGIFHAVQPTSGAASGYWRMKAGFESATWNSKDVNREASHAAHDDANSAAAHRNMAGEAAADAVRQVGKAISSAAKGATGAVGSAVSGVGKVAIDLGQGVVDAFKSDSLSGARDALTMGKKNAVESASGAGERAADQLATGASEAAGAVRAAAGQARDSAGHAIDAVGYVVSASGSYLGSVGAAVGGYVFTALVLGSTGREVTALLGNMPGALQLLPNGHYQNNCGDVEWLRVDSRVDTLGFVRVPSPQDYADPYRRLYAEDKTFWRLITDKSWLHPGLQVDDAGPWKQYLSYLEIAAAFHKNMHPTGAAAFKHPRTWNLYGEGHEHETVDQLTFTILPTSLSAGLMHEGWALAMTSLGDKARPLRLIDPNAGGFEAVGTLANGEFVRVVLEPPTGEGDGTVARSSGALLAKNVESRFCRGASLGHQPACLAIVMDNELQEFLASAIIELCVTAAKLKAAS